MAKKIYMFDEEGLNQLVKALEEGGYEVTIDYDGALEVFILKATNDIGTDFNIMFNGFATISVLK